VRRRRGHAAPENHERWMVSYADFITLMFAFFVVMFASSQADRSKVKRVSEAVTRALENGTGGGVPTVVTEMFTGKPSAKNAAFAVARALPPKPGPPTTAGPSGDLRPSLDYLKQQLKREMEKGEMRIRLEGRGLVVSLQQATFFPSGEDSIDPATYSSLQKVATAISNLPNPVRLEGHTDAIPIHTARFHSNWELSAARSIAVLELLNGRFNVPRERLAIAGYAETVPVAANDSEQGRARNRRVDIVILNLRQTTEPVVLEGGAQPAAVPKQTGIPHASM